MSVYRLERCSGQTYYDPSGKEDSKSSRSLELVTIALFRTQCRNLADKPFMATFSEGVIFSI